MQVKLCLSAKTVADYRKELINKTRVELKCKSDSEAITHLFPVENKKAREAARLEISSTSLALTQLLNLLWPSEDIRLLMVNDPDISAAVVNSDLIAWNTAFQSFCLSGSVLATLVKSHSDLKRGMADDDNSNKRPRGECYKFKRGECTFGANCRFFHT